MGCTEMETLGRKTAQGDGTQLLPLLKQLLITGMKNNRVFANLQDDKSLLELHQTQGKFN